jgi:hypothetical protein
LRIAVAAVLGAALTLLMCHISPLLKRKKTPPGSAGNVKSNGSRRMMQGRRFARAFRSTVLPRLFFCL